MFFGVIALLSVFLYKNITNKSKVIVIETQESTYVLENFMDSISVTMTVYGFMQNLFPIAT